MTLLPTRKSRGHHSGITSLPASCSLLLARNKLLRPHQSNGLGRLGTSLGPQCSVFSKQALQTATLDKTSRICHTTGKILIEFPEVGDRRGCPSSSYFSTVVFLRGCFPSEAVSQISPEHRDKGCPSVSTSSLLTIPGFFK